MFWTEVFVTEWNNRKTETMRQIRKTTTEILASLIQRQDLDEIE